MTVMEKLLKYASSANKRVIFPEGDDERTVRAATELINRGLAHVTVLGEPEEISKNFEKAGARENPEIINITSDKRLPEFISDYYEKRKSKGITQEEAKRDILDPLFFGAMMVEKGYASGCVAGAVSPSARVLQAALRVIGVKEGVKAVSSFMMLETKIREYGRDGTLFFADVAVNPDPTSEILADIAMAASNSWKIFMDCEARTAFLSFSTKGSANTPSAEKARAALKILKEKRPDLTADGELQADAALVPSVGQRKALGSPVAGRANVLIFPNLDAANIGYKLTERFSPGAAATGPVLQGLKKPMNDLSRGSSWEDIFKTALVTIYQSSGENL